MRLGRTRLRSFALVATALASSTKLTNKLLLLPFCVLLELLIPSHCVNVLISIFSYLTVFSPVQVLQVQHINPV